MTPARPAIRLPRTPTHLGGMSTTTDGSARRPAAGFEAARTVLARHFGFPDFRPGQDQAVRAVLAGRDVLVLMPTGGGKSLCYQVPSQCSQRIELFGT